MLGVGHGEIHDLKVVLNLVERGFSNVHFGADFKPSLVDGRGEHVNVIDVVKQPGARERPVHGADVERARHAGSLGIKQR